MSSDGTSSDGTSGPDDTRTGAEAGGVGPSIEPWVRDILRCPACGSTLADGTRDDGDPELVCTADTCALAYPVRDGVPVLLVDEARSPG